MNTTPIMWPARPYIGQMMIKLLRDNMMIDDHHMMIDDHHMNRSSYDD